MEVDFKKNYFVNTFCEIQLVADLVEQARSEIILPSKSVYEVVLQKSVLAQIRQFVPCISNDEG